MGLRRKKPVLCYSVNLAEHNISPDIQKNINVKQLKKMVGPAWQHPDVYIHINIKSI